MDRDDRIPIRVAHPMKDPVAQNTRVVDHDVEGAKSVHRALHDTLATGRLGDAVGIGNRLTTGGFDIRDRLRRRSAVGSLTVHRASEVVHDHPRTAAGHEQSYLTTNSPARPRHHCYLSFEHVEISLYRVHSR